MGKRLAGEEESSQVGPGGQLRGGENLGHAPTPGGTLDSARVREGCSSVQ